MAYDTLDPLDSFVDRFRMMCGGDHVIVGPPGSAAQANRDRQVIQVIGPPRVDRGSMRLQLVLRCSALPAKLRAEPERGPILPTDAH